MTRGIRRLFQFSSRTGEDVRQDIDDEFQFHLDMRIAELRREGMTERDARRQAAREFGNADAGARACAGHGQTIERQRWLVRVLSELGLDVTYGWRLITRSPGFSAIAILTLAIAIGGNTAIFGVINAMFFKPAPFAAPRELARIYTAESQMSWPNYEDLRTRSSSFSDVTAHRGIVLSLATGDEPVRLNGQAVTNSFFTVLGVPAALGRTFVPADTRSDVIVLSDRIWRVHFSADPAIVGRTITLNGRPFEVLGVMPRLFRGMSPPGLVGGYWTPIDPADRQRQDRTANRFQAVGRLKPGVNLAQATAELRVIAARLRTEHPEINERFANTEALAIDGIESFRGVANTLMPVFAFLALMTIVAGIVLFIGCANIAGLLLGRAAARRREIAVRLALGAGRGRLVRQLLTESLMLAVAGGAAGILLAVWLSGTLNLLATRLPFPIEFDLALDWRVLAYALVLSVATAIVFGLAPARRAARIDLVPSLKDEAGSVRRQRLRHALVIGQVALCSLLLAWGGLFTRSLARAVNVNPGFEPAGVLVADVDLGEVTDKDARTDAFIVELQQRVAQLPGVESAGCSLVVPLALMGREEFRLTLLDDPAATRPWAMGNRVTPGWFRTVRIPIVAGRDFTWDDRLGAPGVIIVNETLARRLGSGTAVGKRLKWPDAEIVGVVADSKYWTIGETIAPAVYRPFRQTPGGGPILHVRTTNMAATAPALRLEVRRLAPTVAPDIKPMSEAVAVATMPARAGAWFTGGFGVLAVLLATLGLYGLVSFSVVQRRKEIGIRKAIGADTPQIVRLVVRMSLSLVSIGLAVGVGLAVLGGQLLRALIVGVSPADPLTLVSVTVLVLTAATAASAIPALRAARVDPLVTLRSE